ncbi:hypothetical protein TrLO_g2501 [Triparma laevis f. longispina]|uniref:N-acetylglucosamine-6-phosphate deacetylase n=1 Tax=Triparma laevis f. longispina TaxID=1714387 RepID=A0A9W7CBG8_9STRA|nr:hypothetical protein TrLO_g2501 [Triparma laevis f. longispina]
MSSYTSSPSPPLLFTNCLLLNPLNSSPTPRNLLVVDGLIVDEKEYFYNKSATLNPVVVDCEGKVLMPGMIDVQINGSHGCDYSSLSNGFMIMHSRLELLKTGCTSHCPTLVSLSKEEYHGILPQLVNPPSPYDSSHYVVDVVSENIGIHLEGPHFCPSKKGAHKIGNIHDPSESKGGRKRDRNSNQTSVFETWKDLVGPSWNSVKIVTLAPELPNSMKLINALSENGIVPSVGHSSSTYSVGSEAVKNGANLITHLYNAMTPFHHREPGLIGLSQTTNFSIISDGVHVHPTGVKFAFEGNKNGCCLVTDAMGAMGLQDGMHKLGEMEVEKVGTKVVIKGTDTLAGSVARLDDCLKNFLEFTGCTLTEGVRCVTSNPARVVGLEGKKGSVEVGADADLILWDDGVKRLWKGGVEVEL